MWFAILLGVICIIIAVQVFIKLVQYDEGDTAMAFMFMFLLVFILLIGCIIQIRRMTHKEKPQYEKVEETLYRLK
jgi:Na+/melibiose symporter-like transporter